jgi:hypothetical protein
MVDELRDVTGKIYNLDLFGNDQTVTRYADSING